MADDVKGQIVTEWEKLVTGQVAHLESFFAEVAKLENKGIAQFQTAVEEGSRYAREGLAQLEKVSAEWRKAAIETAKKTAQLVTPKTA